MTAQLCSTLLKPHVKKGQEAKIAPINFMPDFLKDKKHRTNGTTKQQLRSELGRYKNVETVSAADVRVRSES